MVQTRNLHELIMTELSRRGFDRFVEHPGYPSGISVIDASELLKRSGEATLLLVPADLVRDSSAAIHLEAANMPLNGSYVVYIAERDGAGHDPGYG